MIEKTEREITADEADRGLSLKVKMEYKIESHRSKVMQKNFWVFNANIPRYKKI